MKKQHWHPYLDRLKTNPSDQEALQKLEQLLEQSSTQSNVTQKAKKVGVLGRFGLKMFLGKPLYKAVSDGWDAWSAYFQGTYSPSTSVAWPELETRDISAAVANRFLRIGMFAIFVGLIPAIILGFQTALMIIQVWQVNVQNDIVREQNSLTRQQFAVGYSTQLKQQIYAGDCTDRLKPSTCKPSELPGVRADAAQALVRLADIATQASPDDDAPRARIKGALLQHTDLSDVDFKGVELDHTSFEQASLTKTVFTSASLKETSFKQAQINNVDFSSARLFKATFSRARLNEATFKSANLQGTDFERSIIKKSSFENARFYPDEKPVVRDQGQTANFHEAEVLSDVTFDKANLIKANFSQKSWLRLSFKEANLTQSSFAGASLTSSSFKNANLDGANFEGAKLIDVDLTGATFKGAKVSNITLKQVTCPDGKKNQSTCRF